MSALNHSEKSPWRRGGGTICPQQKADGTSEELREWIKGTARKDLDAFTALYQSLVQRIHHYVGIHISAPEDVKDITQEAFIAVWKNASSYAGQASVVSWVLGIARRKIADYYRRKYRQEDWLETDSFDEEMAVTAEDEGSALEMSRVVDRIYWDKILSRISPQEKELVYLCFDAGLTYQEIAEIQSIPVGTVKSRMFNVRRKLVELIRKEE